LFFRFTVPVFSVFRFRFFHFKSDLFLWLFRCFDEFLDRLENDLNLSIMALDELFELRQDKLCHAMSFSPSKISGWCRFMLKKLVPSMTAWSRIGKSCDNTYL